MTVPIVARLIDAATSVYPIIFSASKAYTAYIHHCLGCPFAVMFVWVYVFIRRATATLMKEDPTFCRDFISACPDFQAMYQTNQERLDVDEKFVYMKPATDFSVVRYNEVWRQGSDVRMFRYKDGSHVLAVYKEHGRPGDNLVLTISPGTYILGGRVEYMVYTIAGTIVGRYQYHVADNVTVGVLKRDLLNDMRGQNRYPPCTLERVLILLVVHV